MSMTRFINNRTLLVIILFLAAFLRLWKLGTIPPHLTPDEAALGYNAYSILKTGKDFWGQSFPIIFKSFGDYTPGLYVYLAVPFVAVLGLTEFAVRVPSAILGVITVYFVFLLAKEVFERAKYNNFEKIALFSALLSAVNPWLIQFSRGAWVPNLALALTLAGIYYFFKSIEKGKFIILSAIFFALTTISYQGAKLSTAIVVFLLGILFIDHLKKIDKKLLVGAIAAGVIICSPIFVSFYTGQAGRLSVVSAFSYPRSFSDMEKIFSQGNENPGDISAIAFHTEPLNFVRVVLGKWFNHFSGRFLFFEGDWDNPRHNPPNMGMLLLADAVLILAGLIQFIRKGTNKYFLFVLLWLVIAPLPAILSRDRVHAVRSLHMVIPLIMISSLALYNLFTKASRKLIGIVFIFVFAAGYLLNYVYYLDSYYIHLSKHGAKYWEYGYKQVVEYINENGLSSRRIVFQQAYAQPFIYFLFYGEDGYSQKWDPTLFQQSVVYEASRVGDVGLVSKMGNIDFQFLSWPYKYPAGTVVVADEVVAPRNLVTNDYTTLREVLRPDGSMVFLIMEAK